jgi:hypothetical protein
MLSKTPFKIHDENFPHQQSAFKSVSKPKQGFSTAHKSVLIEDIVTPHKFGKDSSIAKSSSK